MTAVVSETGAAEMPCVIFRALQFGDDIRILPHVRIAGARQGPAAKQFDDVNKGTKNNRCQEQEDHDTHAPYMRVVGFKFNLWGKSC